MPADLLFGVVVGAAAASKSVRKAVRRGLLYGVGSVLVAYDKVAAFAHETAQGARKGLAAATESGSPAAAAPAPTVVQKSTTEQPAPARTPAEAPSS
jgi:hypothetical protein